MYWCFIALWLVCGCHLLSLSSLCSAQIPPPIALQASTLNAVQTDCTYSSVLDDTFSNCPPNTCHVVIQRAVPWLTAESGVLWQTNLSIGCCPKDLYGIYDSTDNLLYGCCSTTDSPSGVPVPCFNTQRRMIGCTNYASRCCTEQICSKGYVCCGGQCCPALGTDPYSLETSCATQLERDPLTGESISVYRGCIDPSSLFTCQPLTTYSVSCPPYDVNDPSITCPFCPYPDITCTFPPPNLPALQLPCGSAGDCIKTNLVIKNCSGVVLGCTDNVSVVDIPVGCSSIADKSDVCVYPSVGTAPILVGDREVGETCCGPYICAPGMKCCSNTTVALNVFEQPFNRTEFFGCCPDVPEISCCYNNIMRVRDTRSTANFFCGSTYNFVPCQVDKMRPPLYFAIARLALNYAPAS